MILIIRIIYRSIRQKNNNNLHTDNVKRTFSTRRLFQNQIDVLKPLQCKTKWLSFVEQVDLYSGFSGSDYMEWVALFSWI